jgi:hypothetical protein
MRITLGFRQRGRGLIRYVLMTLLVLLLPLWGQSRAASGDDASVPGASVSANKATQAGPANGAQSDSKQGQGIKLIDGHVLANPYEVVTQPGPPRERFRKLRQERLWAVTELEQQRSELNRLLSESHQRPVPVPGVSEVDYNARVNDIDSKIRTFEAQQNNGDLTETVRSEARAQLLDLTRQKARAALDLITYRNTQQQLAAFNNVMSREEAAKSVTADTLSYLSKIDEGISELMMSSDSESFFRLWMGAGFLALVLVLIICFFIFGSRSGSMREIFRNDRGLQFITLFSLVIAITMFGLLNILEGKELSALLGGLSGYILGRSNLGGGDDRDKSGGLTVPGGASPTGHAPTASPHV